MAIFRCERPRVEGVQVVCGGRVLTLGWGDGYIDSREVAQRRGFPAEAVELALRSHPEYGNRIFEDGVLDYSAPEPDRDAESEGVPPQAESAPLAEDYFPEPPSGEREGVGSEETPSRDESPVEGTDRVSVPPEQTPPAPRREAVGAAEGVTPQGVGVAAPAGQTGAGVGVTDRVSVPPQESDPPEGSGRPKGRRRRG